MKRTLTAILIGILCGCSSQNSITNQEVTEDYTPSSSLSTNAAKQESDVAIILTFSGGGTRAAALSYGVLKGLRDLEYTDQNLNKNLLSQVSAISSVSGGSFTSAYYGLYGDQIFETFEDEFLYRDVSSNLIDILFSPSYIFSRQTRTVAAATYYNQSLFNQATFAEFREDSPLIIINASDLGGGVRFSFLPEYFDLICSDIEQYSVADAVAASSAVPFIFEPVVLKNFDQCDRAYKYKLNHSDAMSPHIRSTKDGLASYADKEKRKYIHLVDGGITDNLGLLAIYDLAESQRSVFNKLDNSINKIIVISVDASTNPDWGIDDTIESPSTADTIGAMSDVQLHRYNDVTKYLVIEKLSEWEEEKKGRETLFVDISLQSAKQSLFMNAIPTDFELESEQVDALISHGYEETLNNPALKKLSKNME